MLASLAAARWLPVAVAELGSLDPRARVAATPPSAAIHPASGPIVVTIEYRVPAENAAESAAVINELGRLRRRDGARAWSVCQDIDATEQANYTYLMQDLHWNCSQRISHTRNF